MSSRTHHACRYDCEESLARFSGVVTRQAHVNGEGVCKSLITDVPADGGKGRWSLGTRPPRTLKQHFETCLKVTHRNSCANLDVKAAHTRSVASTLPPLPPLPPPPPPPPPPTYR